MEITPSPNGVPYPRTKRNRQWLYVSLGLIALIAIAYGLMFLLVWQLSSPAARSVDEIEIGQIESMSILAINRPDGGPDISGGGKNLLPIPAEYFEQLLTPLRNAPLISTSRGIYLGEIRLIMKDGRKLTIMLHRDQGGTNSSTPPMLRSSIEQYQYDAGPLDKFLQPLIAVEASIRMRS